MTWKYDERQLKKRHNVQLIDYQIASLYTFFLNDCQSLH